MLRHKVSTDDVYVQESRVLFSGRLEPREALSHGICIAIRKPSILKDEERIPVVLDIARLSSNEPPDAAVRFQRRLARRSDMQP